MLGPLPINSTVKLDLNPGQTVLHVSGTVRSSQPGFGMGIEFGGMSLSDYEKLRSIASLDPPPSDPERTLFRSPTAEVKIEASSASHQSAPSPESFNGHHATTAEALEAVLRVLFRKGLLTRAELADEIESLKTIKVASLP
jgi:hypothetical protein